MNGEAISCISEFTEEEVETGSGRLACVAVNPAYHALGSSGRKKERPRERETREG